MKWRLVTLFISVAVGVVVLSLSSLFLAFLSSMILVAAVVTVLQGSNGDLDKSVYWFTSFLFLLFLMSTPPLWLSVYSVVVGGAILLSSFSLIFDFIIVVDSCCLCSVCKSFAIFGLADFGIGFIIVGLIVMADDGISKKNQDFVKFVINLIFSLVTSVKFDGDVIDRVACFHSRWGLLGVFGMMWE